METGDKTKKAKPKPSKPAVGSKTSATPSATGGAKVVSKAAPAGAAAGADAPTGAKEKAVAPAAPAPPMRVAPTGSTGVLNKKGVGLGRGMMGPAAREGVQKARARGRSLAGAASAAPGMIFSAATATKAAKASIEETEAADFKGQFSKDVRAMMYGYGDDPVPLKETADLVEDIMLQYLASVLSRSSQVAADSLKQKPDEKDVLFVVRKDPAKFSRVKELLVMQQVIKDARNSFKDEMVASSRVSQGDVPDGGAE